MAGNILLVLHTPKLWLETLCSCYIGPNYGWKHCVSVTYAQIVASITYAQIVAENIELVLHMPKLWLETLC